MEKKEIESLYDENSLGIMKTAEDSFIRGANRIQEIKNFARKANIKRIGIANCISFTKEAALVKEFLSDEFEVHNVDCKFGKITKQEMLDSEGKSVMCNPAGQADFLKKKKTELNISMGLCVGHDMIFNQKSTSPVSTLIVKDRVNKHNTLESIKSISLGDE